MYWSFYIKLEDNNMFLVNNPLSNMELAAHYKINKLQFVKDAVSLTSPKGPVYPHLIMYWNDALFRDSDVKRLFNLKLSSLGYSIKENSHDIKLYFSIKVDGEDYAIDFYY